MRIFWPIVVYRVKFDWYTYNKLINCKCRDKEELTRVTAEKNVIRFRQFQIYFSYPKYLFKQVAYFSVNPKDEENKHIS